MNRDFAEMLSALSAAGVEFLVGPTESLCNKAATGRPKEQADLVWLRDKLKQ